MDEALGIAEDTELDVGLGRIPAGKYCIELCKVIGMDVSEDLAEAKGFLADGQPKHSLGIVIRQPFFRGQTFQAPQPRHAVRFPQAATGG